MNNPNQLNYTQQLEHRLAMVLDDIKALSNYLEENNLIGVLNSPTKYSDDAWCHIHNIEYACDLENDESLSWKLYSKTK